MLKKVVVTAATKGIGRAIAFRFLDAGYDVAVCARKHEELLQMQHDAIQADMPGNLFTSVCDVTDFGATKSFL